MNEQELFAQRMQRVKTAIALGEPDRVPFVPTVGNVYALEYGGTIRAAMEDQRLILPAVDAFLDEVKPDYFKALDFFPKKAMDILQPININYPGKLPEYGDNFTYQIADHTFMDDEEYEDFLKDPSAYLRNKVIATKFKTLGGLQIYNPYSLCGSTVMGFAQMAIPPLANALETMIKAGQEVQSYIQTSVEATMHIIKRGFPVWGASVAMAPFDDFADNIRGLLNTVMDLKTDPELLGEAVERYAEVTIPAAINLAKMQHQDTMFIPLHVGVDEFMSPDDYETYYWPTLKRLIMACINADITPFVMCEGNYFTRLQVIKDVPKGKVVYFFEKQDMANAKKELSGIACIGGNFDTGLLMHGTKEQVVEETKRLLDLLAPGGGYMMSNNISIDNCKRENLVAWYEATEKYGRYR